MSAGKVLGEPADAAPPRPRGRRRGKSTALARVEAFLREVAPDASDAVAPYVREMIVTAIRLIDDGASVADVKLLNASVRELRYAFRLFAHYRSRRKVATFGSARTAPDAPEYVQAERFAGRIADEGFMIITGAGSGIMRACQSGAGRDRSFGVNIRLPFEQLANEFIADDPKLLKFKYFFTRKLMFIKEADAVALFPGGFGTHDEAYEALTLVQTGKSSLVPIVFVDAPGGRFWRDWLEGAVEKFLRDGLIAGEDLHLFRVTDDAEEAVQEILRFYRVYHSSRYVRDRLVLRLNRPPSGETLARLNHDFTDVLVSGHFVTTEALPEEAQDETADLPRLVFHFNRVNYGRLRQLIDVLNAEA